MSIISLIIPFVFVFICVEIIIFIYWEENKIQICQWWIWWYCYLLWQIDCSCFNRQWSLVMGPISSLKRTHTQFDSRFIILNCDLWTCPFSLRINVNVYEKQANQYHWIITLPINVSMGVYLVSFFLLKSLYYVI